MTHGNQLAAFQVKLVVNASRSLLLRDRSELLIVGLILFRLVREITISVLLLHTCTSLDDVHTVPPIMRMSNKRHLIFFSRYRGTYAADEAALFRNGCRELHCVIVAQNYIFFSCIIADLKR